LRTRETSLDLEGRQSRWQGVNTGTEIRFVLLSTFRCSVLSVSTAIEPEQANKPSSTCKTCTTNATLKERPIPHGALKDLPIPRAQPWNGLGAQWHVLLFLIGCEHMCGSAVETQMARRSREGCESFFCGRSTHDQITQRGAPSLPGLQFVRTLISRST